MQGPGPGWGLQGPGLPGGCKIQAMDVQWGRAQAQGGRGVVAGSSLCVARFSLWEGAGSRLRVGAGPRLWEGVGSRFWVCAGSRSWVGSRSRSWVCAGSRSWVGAGSRVWVSAGSRSWVGAGSRVRRLGSWLLRYRTNDKNPSFLLHFFPSLSSFQENLSEKATGKENFLRGVHVLCWGQNHHPRDAHTSASIQLSTRTWVWSRTPNFHQATSVQQSSWSRVAQWVWRGRWIETRAEFCSRCATYPDGTSLLSHMPHITCPPRERTSLQVWFSLSFFPPSPACDKLFTSELFWIL